MYTCAAEMNEIEAPQCSIGAMGISEEDKRGVLKVLHQAIRRWDSSSLVEGGFCPFALSPSASLRTGYAA